jgi:futalosine hydrolase
VILVVAATERELAGVEGAETLCCGIGPVEAAIATANALSDRRPDAILHVGIAGAAQLEPCTAVIGTEAVYCDILDSSSTLPRVERVEPTPELVEAAHRALPDAHLLPITTCGRVGAAGEGEVEAMEGFGVLRAAKAVGVSAVEVRVVSNSPSEGDRRLWRIEDALARLREVVPRLVQEVGMCLR